MSLEYHNKSFFYHNDSHEKKISFVQNLLLVLFLYLYTLSPYFDLSGIMLHGGMLSIVIFWGCHARIAMQTFTNKTILLVFLTFFLFSIYNFLVMIFYLNEFSASFQSYIIQIAIYTSLGFSVGLYMRSQELDVNKALDFIFKAVVLIVFINSVIVIIEYFVPPFRSFIESLLYLSENSNINYLTREYRLRGIASGGAANLSLFHGISLILLQTLYIKKKVSLFYFLSSSVTIFTSMLFIGRTGIVIAILGIAIFHFFNIILSQEKLSLRRLSLLSSVFIVAIIIPPAFAIFFPDNVLGYSISFLYQGTEGLQEEGTTETIIQMFHFPDEWYKLVFGVGYHYGDFSLLGRKDPGYMKMLTALGIPVSILFYCFVIYLAKNIFIDSDYKSFWVTFVIIIFISEIKEPFIFKGYSARLLWLIIGVGLCYSFYKGINYARVNLTYKNK